MHAYEIRLSKDHRGGYAMHRSGSHDVVIAFTMKRGDVIETHEQRGEFKEW